jgi:hypothetical protein
LRYRFFGYGLNGVWNALVTDFDNFTEEQTHTFSILRHNGNQWDATVDGVNEGSYFLAQGANFVMTGLESYDAPSTVQSYNHYNLTYNLHTGGPYSWSGENDKQVDLPQMCGFWASATDWKAGENVTC